MEEEEGDKRGWVLRMRLDDWTKHTTLSRMGIKRECGPSFFVVAVGVLFFVFVFVGVRA